MSSRLNPYVTYDGNARAAMAYYQEVFGGELTISTFGELGAADEAIKDQVMHAQLETTAGYTIMASDLPPGMGHQPGGAISISLFGDDGDALRGYWNRLSDGGQVGMPLEKQVWGDEFGQCTDRFGVSWMVNISGPSA